LIHRVAELDGYLKELEETLATLKGETRVLNRNLLRREDLKTDRVAQLTRIQSELATLERTTRETQLEGEAQAAIQAKLADAKQSLTEEMQALLKGYQKSVDETVIGGIPVDSEYVIFIIDTSGSMFS
jgi:chromosome segregation ATPase